MAANNEQSLKFFKEAKGDIVCLLKDAGLPDSHARLVGNLGAALLTDLNRLANAAEGVERSLEKIANEVRDLNVNRG